MKKQIGILILLSAVIFLLGSCKGGRVATAGGVDNVAKLQFVRGTTEKYSDGVDVFVDNNEPFRAKVDKLPKVTGNVYTIQNGNRHIKVEYKGEVLYDRNIVIAIGETRQIQLP